MGDAIEYCEGCPTNQACHLNRGCLKLECESPSCADTCSTWIRTAHRLPGQIGDQVDVLMWSPEWATWLKGLVTRWEDKCEWAIYNQQDDRYHEWEHVPEFWMSPILPNAGGMAAAPEDPEKLTNP